MKRPKMFEVWERDIQDEDDMLDWIDRANDFMDELEVENKDILDDYRDVVAENKRLKESISDWRAHLVAFTIAADPAEAGWKESTRDIANEMLAALKEA